LPQVRARSGALTWAPTAALDSNSEGPTAGLNYRAWEKSSTTNHSRCRSTTPTPIESISRSRMLPRCEADFMNCACINWGESSLSYVLGEPMKRDSGALHARRQPGLALEAVLRRSACGHHLCVTARRCRQQFIPAQRRESIRPARLVYRSEQLTFDSRCRGLATGGRAQREGGD